MEFKEATTPTLTMDPFKEMDKAEIIEISQEPETMDDNILSPEERQMVNEFAEQIYSFSLVLFSGSPCRTR